MAQNQHNRQLQDEQRQNELQVNMGIMNDPAATGDMKAQAHQNIQGLYPTPAHRGNFLADVLHLHGKQQAQQAIPPSSPSQPDDSDPRPTGPLGLPMSGPQQPPSSSATGPMGLPANGPTQPNLSAVGAAQTPQAAMDLWKQYRGPVAINEDIAQQRAAKAAEYAQALEKQRAQANIDLAHERATMGVGITPENRYLQQYAVQHGYETASQMPTEAMGDAMRQFRQSNATPGWKSVVDGNNVYAIDSHNPNGPRTLVGHKDDLTERQEFRTMTNPDMSTYIVPVTVWTKKGSSTPVMETQDDQGGAPVSASTPQGPGGASPPPVGAATPSTPPPTAPATPQASAPVSSATPQGVPGGNPGARQPGSRPAGAAVKTASTRIPSSSVGAPIPFGGKPSELLKSDTSQYTKVAEDANGAEESFNALAPLYTPGSGQKPTPSSDQELVFAWVRANVQGAGRMTQTEVQQGSSVGSFGDKVQNWLSKAKDGTMTPNIEQMLFADIKRGVSSKQALAAKLRDQVQQGMGSAPASSKTPKAPGAWAVPKDAPAPTKVNQVLKANGQVIARSVDGKTWSQP